MNVGFQLFQLQSIDSEIDLANTRNKEIMATIESDATVAHAETLLNKTEVELRKIKNDFESIDYEIQQKKVKKTQSEANLYSGKIQNPKELQDLQTEITFLSKALSDLDNRLLEQLEKLEATEQTASDRRTTLKQALTTFETNKSRLSAEKNNLENTLRNLAVKRTSQVAQIGADTLQIYERLRKTKNGLAIARLQDNSCSACGASLTASQCQQVHSSSQLFFCPSCGRIVYGS